MPQENSKGIIPRPPVVGIFGHIDHGKSTLLDYIRSTNITEKEAGGITQHISAYEVSHTDQEGKERLITFLDTPGHEAFKAMRSRGASAADVAVLVVSAEDGVKPQTLEALTAIIESKTPYIVAINKIDKPAADIERTKQSLLEAGIYIEGYGGSIPAIALSAKTGEGVPALLDMILLVADLESFTGNTEDPASGIVIESSLDTKKGVAATLIIKNGTLRKGSFVVSGESFAPVRIMENFLGQAIEEAHFSSPVRIIGWSGTPKAGDVFNTCDSKKEAEEIVKHAREDLKKQSAQAFEIPEGAVAIPLIIKADTAGSIEAVRHEINKIETETVRMKTVETGVGAITENDVKLLSGAEGGIIVGFAVRADARAVELAERQNIPIQTFDVIYKVAEWLEQVVTERTPKVATEEVRGTLKVLKTFSRTKNIQVIGGRVDTGKISVGDKVKIIRREDEIGVGEVEEVQVQKLKTREALAQSECGLSVESKLEIVPGDTLRSFVIAIK